MAESTVLVYGTNLAGYRAAYALAKIGYKTILLNRGAYVDQYRNQALAQLPLDFCWICGHMPQRLFIGLGAMEVHYNAQILEVNGEPGNFVVRFKKRDPYVNNFACTECSACVTACPIEVETPSGKRKAIYEIPYIGWENVYLIDEKNCTKCGKCEEVCPTKCLKVDRPVEEKEVKVGTIILATEYEEPLDEDLKKFGYGHPNVVKNSDLARRSLLTNFVRNSLIRPSDGKLAQKIAVILTPQYNPKEFESYNLSVSCVYRAYRIKEVYPEANVKMFFREFKGYGKGHYQWLGKALSKGVELARADDLEVIGKGENLVVKYSLYGKAYEEEFEMVILVTGQRAPSVMEELRKVLKVEPDEFGFCKVDPFTSGKTSVEGIFAVGELTGPKGNPEIVWEGYGVVSEVLKYLGEPNFAPQPPPPFREVRGEPPKVGVFICSCFGEFNNYIDLERLKSKVSEIPGVTHVDVVKGCCTPPTMQEVAQKIKESGVNRVVLAVCTILQKLLRFRRVVMMAGLNPLLSEFLRLREDVIRVHEDRDKMLEKAYALIYGGVEKVKRAVAYATPVGKIKTGVIVLGGGPAGLEVARLLAENKVPVFLVEKSKELGGLAKTLTRDLEGHNIRDHLAELIRTVEENERIKVFKGFELVEFTGTAGNYYALIENKESHEKVFLEAGAVVLAVGGVEFKPYGAYYYGEDDRVLTQRELEEAISKDAVKAKKVVMIQCVGSRNETRPYCSRVCCSHALKNALALVEKGVEVTILYRDLNTYGFKENYKKIAEESGIKFIRFGKDKYPQVISRDPLTVKVETTSGDELTLNADLLVLSVGIIPNPDNERLAKLLNFRLDEYGFFDSDANACPYEEAIKRIMKPFELSTKGIFAVGLAHSPRSYTEAILTAKDAVGKILTFIRKPQLPAPNAMYVSAVKESKCTGCGMCVVVCPYYARSIDKGRKIATVTPYLCDSCGACLVACPSEAAYLRDARGEMMVPYIDALLM
ncbi:MAG: FAD-dependent oxidoreductase [Caldimicrobium sp.]